MDISFSLGVAEYERFMKGEQVYSYAPGTALGPAIVVTASETEVHVVTKYNERNQMSFYVQKVKR